MVSSVALQSNTGFRAWRRSIGFAVLIGLTPMASGCFGHFPLTRIVYKVNGSVTNFRLIHTLIFWLFNIFPVYGIAMIGDAFILNLIEFWTGLKIDVTTAKLEDGTQIVLSPGKSDHEAVLEVSKNGEVVNRRHFVRQLDGSVHVLDMDGQKVGVVLPRAGGGFDLLDADGSILQGIPGETVAALRAG
jgi:hypothetical protein